MKDIRFVQLEAGAFLTDLDFVVMDATARGVYVTLILYLYTAGGKCAFDMGQLGRICNCENFDAVWEKIEKKFQIRRGFLKHKRVTRELKRAQTYRRARVKGAKKRWDKSCSADAEKKLSICKGKESKGKERKGK